jgi:hypothetical protein
MLNANPDIRVGPHTSLIVEEVRRVFQEAGYEVDMNMAAYFPTFGDDFQLPRTDEPGNFEHCCQCIENEPGDVTTEMAKGTGRLIGSNLIHAIEQAPADMQFQTPVTIVANNGNCACHVRIVAWLKTRQ